MTEKQRRFVEAYLGEARGNATQAARMAGYADPEAMARDNPRKPRIQQAIDKRLKEAAAKGLIPDATEVLTLLGDHARASMADFIEVMGRTAVINMAKAEQAGKLHLIKEIHFGIDGIKLKLQDQQAALITLARYHKLLTDRIDHDISRLSDAQLIGVVQGIVSRRGEGGAGGDGAAGPDVAGQSGDS